MAITGLGLLIIMCARRWRLEDLPYADYAAVNLEKMEQAVYWTLVQ